MKPIVVFRRGRRNGDPIARWKGKPAFPVSEVEVGKRYIVKKALPNYRESVYFLEVIPERFFQGEGLVKPPSVSPLSVGGVGVSADLLRELEVRVLAKLEDRLKEVAEVLAALLSEEVSRAVAEALREAGLSQRGE